MAASEVQTWKPVTAGALNIVNGAMAFLGMVILIILVADTNFWMLFMEEIPPQDFAFAASFINAILIFSIVYTAVCAVFTIIGGIFAIQRKRWGWALAGSIIGILAALPLGIASTILVGMAKDEFES